ncbi:hypothetical protein [Phycicoccus duodecadis]|uniref:Uncharacterized protein n=1 Tax=Phycicoccus duodecadis TaxID=173053 RepID=A0A2N3YFU3_9MICO|nr:hypothetical protein [Phycicoccus duodecadis]PKW25718.1 hypothetical protein ATL31_0517 [Phycicoccus duodecadis]
MPTDDERLERDWRRAGATDESMIDDAVSLGLHPSRVSGKLDDAAGFLSAAAFQDIGDLVEVYLEQAGGDPGVAWELWSDDDGEE